MRKVTGAMITLFHNKWIIPVLAGFHGVGGGAKLITLQSAIGSGRDSLLRTLQILMERGLVRRNPGYGHPMRPEYLLTAAGKRLAPGCEAFAAEVSRLGMESVGYRKWSIPVVQAIAATGGRFNELRAALGAITPRALAQALRDLQEAGVIDRYIVDEDPPRTDYRLTRRGIKLMNAVEPLLRALRGSSH